MQELSDFYNDGCGWTCRKCQDELSATAPASRSMYAEGESENKNDDLGHRALARWTDATRQFLTCPRCGITERVERH
jgi:hypothetical protein